MSIVLERHVLQKQDDVYKTFSVRIPSDIMDQIDQLAKDSGRSRNYIINRLLEEGVDSVVITDGSEAAAPADTALPGLDTVILSARPEVFQNLCLERQIYAHVDARRIPDIRYAAFYVGNPVRAVTHYGKVEDGGIAWCDHAKKYRIRLAQEPLPLDHPVPLGGTSPHATRAPKYTTLGKLFSAAEYRDLMLDYPVTP